MRKIQVTRAKRRHAQVLRGRRVSIGWVAVTQHFSVVQDGDRALTLVVSPNGNPRHGYSLVALEHPPFNGPVASVERILDDHAHEVLAGELGYRAATRMAEAYAKHWLWLRSKDRSTAKRCECAPIRKSASA